MYDRESLLHVFIQFILLKQELIATLSVHSTTHVFSFEDYGIFHSQCTFEFPILTDSPK